MVEWRFQQMEIDYRDSRPIYEQIVDYFRKLIFKGILAPEEQLPSVRSLAMELSTNPNTVQKAYQELERQGYTFSVKGRGSFVLFDERMRQNRIEELKKEIDAVRQEAADLGITMEELGIRFTGETGAASSIPDTESDAELDSVQGDRKDPEPVKDRS